MDVAIWSVLHDGRIIAIEGKVPGILRLSVEIAYLCRHLPTQADQLIVTLTGCERFVYEPYEQSSLDLPSAIAGLGLELLSAGWDRSCISVECADGSYGGKLLLRYASANLHTVEGNPLSQSEIESAADRYWSLWKKKHIKPGDALDRGVT